MCSSLHHNIVVILVLLSKKYQGLRLKQWSPKEICTPTITSIRFGPSLGNDEISSIIMTSIYVMEVHPVLLFMLENVKMS